MFSPPENYTRIVDQNATAPTNTHHSAQHRAAINNCAQAVLGIINSLVTPNHGPLLSAPFTCFSCIFRCASEAGGISRPLNGALVGTYLVPGNRRYYTCGSKQLSCLR